VDSESGEDPEVCFDEEPVVAYLNNPDCSNSTDNGDDGSLIKMSISIIPYITMI